MCRETANADHRGEVASLQCYCWASPRRSISTKTLRMVRSTVRRRRRPLSREFTDQFTMRDVASQDERLAP